MSYIVSSLLAFIGLSLGANQRSLQQATPGQPGVPFIPQIPAIPQGNPLERLCVLDYTDPASCAGKAEIIMNPGDYFQMDCAARGACAQSTTTFQYDTSSASLYIDAVVFSEEYAGYGATIVVENTRPGNQVVLNKLECKAPGACQGLTIILKNADLNELDCSDPNFCSACFIKENLVDPPKPCFGW
eukprot:CAMPEP_0197034890 /NCGR_PEP_ID=MMETSP1384-20130603/12831_1 /TAXON_ID=29189 /ORGANISM="Ammonia sp." /LENGTH=186 /DNA_ID=CAMNT_0042464861 /DNA_START=65 /DNA_END=625 /DNA_ORIENTATION=+